MSDVTGREQITALELAEPPRVSPFKRFYRVFFSRKVVLFGTVVIVLFILMAALAPVIAPYDPYKIDRTNILAKPSAEHWLGTDSVGRDTLSRIIYGSRNSLVVSLIALCMAAGGGLTLGLLAGYFGGAVNMIIMRIVDGLMIIPSMLLALTIAAILGGGMVNVIIALGISMMAMYARLMCGQVLKCKEDDYIIAERSIGASHLRIMYRHIFPNTLPPLIVMMSMQIGTTILAEAGLSFLGIGITPPQASWGQMISEGYSYLLTDPIYAIAPGIAIMLVVFAFNMVGDGLRDALDPRLRGII
ncbi:MAG: ABC transporter permease [Dehalococcoidales bacterium]|jgi:ABC-type dipeptide/oligopeptide/nickel transport system permease subunit|nr:ABC transporter permease [Dehalococcoidales bacterium]